MNGFKVGRVIPNAPLRANASPNRGGLRITRPTLRLLGLLLVLFAPFARAAETIPPAPRNHFNDYAGIIAPATARQLDAELTQFERDTSNQLVVAIFPHMQSDSSIEDYTVRVFQAWKVGLQGRNNGAVLFIFSQDRKLRIVTGYGLEGALPDARCKQIIENEITPHFRSGDFTGGAAAGTRALMAAAKGEYRGTGRSVAEGNRSGGSSVGGLLPMVMLMLLIVFILRKARSGSVVYGRSGRISPWISTGGWGGGGGGGWSGGGDSGGSFSGGGGSSGGGGAGGSW